MRFDRQGRCLTISDQGKGLMGIGRAEITGRRFEEFWPDESHLLIHNYVKRVLGGERCHFDAWRFDGPDRGWWSVRLVPQFGRDRGVEGFLAVSVNITERKRIEEQLRKSEGEYQTLFDNIDLGISYIDPDYTIVTANAAHGRLLEMDPGKFLGKKCYREFEKRDAVCPHCPGRQAMDLGRSVACEVSNLTGSGEEIHVRIKAFPVFGADRKSLGFIEVVENITREKRTEKYLHESEIKFKELTDLLPQTVFETDIQGNIVYTNQSGFAATGYSPEDLPGKVHISQLFNGPEKKRAMAQFEAILSGNGKSGNEYMLRRRDGSSFPCLIFSRPIIRENQAIGVRGIIVDISEQRRLENHLRHASKIEAIGTLAGGIAHDFNNILSAIIGYSELAKMKLAADSPVLEDIQEVWKAGNRAADLVQQILAFSRKGTQEMQPLKVTYIVKEALKLLRASIPAIIEIRQQLNSDCMVMADPTQMHQVVMNLCMNASQSMDDSGGTITVELAAVEVDPETASRLGNIKAGRFCQLRIRDTGAGIPAEHLERIFEPYYTTRQDRQGTGLGLSVVHGIVMKHDGAIVIDSKPGAGTTFEVYLPAMEGAEVKPADPVRETPVGTETILYVDDETAVLQMGRRVLERLGYTVMVAAGSQEALRLFKEDPRAFDLVVTDMTMPKMTGDVLTRKLMALRPDIPVILVSGYSKKMDAAAAAEIGARAFMKKPFSHFELAMIVRAVLDEKNHSMKKG